MEIIRLHPTTYDQGKIINGITKKLWVERYKEPGEFEFTGLASSDLRTELPIGALISHVDSKTVMMVESHLIEEDDENDPEIVIAGRSLDFFFDYRAVADTNAGLYNTATDEAIEYVFSSSLSTWEQLVQLLDEQLRPTVSTWNVMLQIPNIDIRHNITESEVYTTKNARYGSLAKAAQDFMDIADLGIVIERPNTAHSTLDFIVTKGFDKTTSVKFDWAQGDLKKAKYFWTKQGFYNAIRVRGKYLSDTVYPSGLSGFDVRMAMIDDDKLDGNPVYMSGGELALLASKLKAYGAAELGRQKAQTLSEAVISPTNRFKYRTDYNVGDLVRVNGNYGLTANMRVTEFAEVEDQNGQSSYPTVSMV